MTLEDRIADTNVIWQSCCEQKHPWYCSSYRLRASQAGHEACMFTWMVREVRRVDLWELITEKLHEWEPEIVH